MTTGTNDEKISKMKYPALREAIKREHDEANKKLEVIQKGVGGPIRHLIVSWAGDKPARLRTSANRSAKSPGREEARVDVMLDLSIAG